MIPQILAIILVFVIIITCPREKNTSSVASVLLNPSQKMPSSSYISKKIPSSHHPLVGLHEKIPTQKRTNKNGPNNGPTSDANDVLAPS